MHDLFTVCGICLCVVFLLYLSPEKNVLNWHAACSCNFELWTVLELIQVKWVWTIEGTGDMFLSSFPALLSTSKKSENYWQVKVIDLWVFFAWFMYCVPHSFFALYQLLVLESNITYRKKTYWYVYYQQNLICNGLSNVQLSTKFEWEPVDQSSLHNPENFNAFLVIITHICQWGALWRFVVIYHNKST